MPAYNLIGFDPWVCLKDGFFGELVSRGAIMVVVENTHTVHASMDGIFTYMNG